MFWAIVSIRGFSWIVFDRKTLNICKKAILLLFPFKKLNVFNYSEIL